MGGSEGEKGGFGSPGINCMSEAGRRRSIQPTGSSNVTFEPSSTPLTPPAPRSLSSTSTGSNYRVHSLCLPPVEDLIPPPLVFDPPSSASFSPGIPTTPATSAPTPRHYPPPASWDEFAICSGSLSMSGCELQKAFRVADLPPLSVGRFGRLEHEFLGTNREQAMRSARR